MTAVRIGNAHGFWGDQVSAAATLLAQEPELDFVTLDFLAEVSLSILAQQRTRQADGGWPREILEVLRSLVPYWNRGGRCRLIANAGGLNPQACAAACQQVLREAGCVPRTVAVVSGDDVLDQLRGDPGNAAFTNLDTGAALRSVESRLITANAYVGARPIAAALQAGADIVITGRVADPSLTVAACLAFHGWDSQDWDRLAQATVAGHLIECGTQVTGGIETDWLQNPGMARVGFPFVEVQASGEFTVRLPCGAGGHVTRATVSEQLVYEIGNPDNYLSPDVCVSMAEVMLDDLGANAVRVTGARGRPAPPTYKVSATYQDGYRAQGQLTIFGQDAVAKARRAGETVLQRLLDRGMAPRESLIECLGTGACHPRMPTEPSAEQLVETVLRIAVADSQREIVEQFTRELMPLITSGPPGTTGYAEGRPRVHPVFRYWPCLIARELVTPNVTVLPVESAVVASASPAPVAIENRRSPDPRALTGSTDGPAPGELRSRAAPRRLYDLARARSGDKGQDANIGILARRAEDYPRLKEMLTNERVAEWLGIADATRVIRYEFPALDGINFVIRGILANSLRTDAQGKCLGQVLLQMPLEPARTP